MSERRKEGKMRGKRDREKEELFIRREEGERGR